jgi:predicted transglutaminase-like cysteine proteinase
MRQALFGRFKTCVRVPAWRIGVAAALQIGCLGLALVMGGAAPAEAQTLASLPAPSQTLDRTGSARPVAAWTNFCERYPAECAVDVSEPAILTLTPEVWRTIVSVNRSVNKRIKPMTDFKHWGVVDRWDFPDDGYGDCEDYQLLKRRLLVEHGLPRRAMRMTVVIDEQGEGHAVLMVRTDRGDFILDNKRMSVLPWKDTGYVFVKREGHDSLAWVSLNGVTSPTVTANR